VLKTIDLDQFKTYQEKYGEVSPPPGFSKYLDIRHWLADNLQHVFRLKLHHSKSQKILDIGTGCGYFPYLCRYFGHSVVAVDLDEVEMYNDLIKFFKLDRKVWQVKAYENLPDFGARFDLITALAVCFNNHTKPDLWGVSEWEFFLTDLTQNLLNANGRVFIILNAEKKGEYYNDLLLNFFMNSGAQVDGKYIYFSSMSSFRLEKLND
jgi:cyclopropane fatty-acyl-phospholipid synthase-like methyltransferase